MPLISGTEKLQPAYRKRGEFRPRGSLDITPEDDVVNIRKGPLHGHEISAKVLAAERIPALSRVMRAAAGAVAARRCICRFERADVDEALEILAKDFIRSTALDSHDLPTPRPFSIHRPRKPSVRPAAARFHPGRRLSRIAACPLNSRLSHGCSLPSQINWFRLWFSQRFFF